MYVDVLFQGTVYSGTRWGMKTSAGLAGCWIIEFSLCCIHISGQCQRILAGLGKCRLIEVPE